LLIFISERQGKVSKVAKKKPIKQNFFITKILSIGSQVRETSVNPFPGTKLPKTTKKCIFDSYFATLLTFFTLCKRITTTQVGTHKKNQNT